MTIIVSGPKYILTDDYGGGGEDCYGRYRSLSVAIGRYQSNIGPISDRYQSDIKAILL